jgi:cbb3-type cytochrome oxidase subunit 3
METFNHIVLWLRYHAIIFMIVVFALIAISAYWPGQRALMERHATIPLHDGDE